MSSSIEYEFNPPEHLSREEVIKMAKHYVVYWRTEFEYADSRYWSLLEDFNILQKKLENNDKPKQK